MNATSSSMPGPGVYASVVLANLVGLGLVLHDGSIGPLLWPYYLQNLVIAAFTLQRILAVGERRADRFYPRLSAVMFSLCFAALHGPLLLLLNRVAPWQLQDRTATVLLTTVTAWAQWTAWRKQRVADRNANAADLLLIGPFLRILPTRGMLLFGVMLLLGAGVSYSAPQTLALALTALKTAADWFMISEKGHRSN
jgi:Family of unknown function (DUF6498)